MPDPLNYSAYLQLEKILDAQAPLSKEEGKPVHEEMLFIITHQATELWFKQILSDLDAVLDLLTKDHVDDRALGRAITRIKRICEIWQLIPQQLRILETMAPIEFLEFRGLLGTSSGFQSYQFRMVENKVGLNREARIGYGGCPYDRHFTAGEKIDLQSVEGSLTLFDAIQKWLERTPFLDRESFRFLEVYEQSLERWLARERAHLERTTHMNVESRRLCEAGLERMRDNYDLLLRRRDLSSETPGERRLSRKAMIAALFIRLYREEPALTLPDQLLDSLIDLDSAITQFRYRHSAMVLKMIGRKMGTGGSTGYDYLQQTADQHRVFGDLFRVVTLLLPKSVLPPLPGDLQHDLDFAFAQNAPTP